VNERSDCGELAELAPELALGIATGAERARALEHVADCADCRRRLEELSEIADTLLLLAPAREPPNGFEARVQQRLAAEPRGRRPRRRVAPAAAALLLVAVLAGGGAGGGVFLATRADRELAAGYESSLRTAEGRYFTASNLYETGEGRVVAGTVFGYAGSPSWVFLTLRPSAGTGPFACTLVLADGRRVPLGTFTLSGTEPSWARTLQVDLQDAARLELREVRAGGDGRGFVAQLRHP
jgi:hypothetical protein